MKGRVGGFAKVPDVVCEHETHLALLCIFLGREVWVPKSQISSASEVQGEGDFGTLVVTKWFAEKEDL